MTGRLITIRPDGSTVSQEIEAEPELQTLNDIVGGYIELIHGFTTFGNEPCIAFCNEEGKLHGLPLNIPATLLWRQAGAATTDQLVGNVAIITGDAILRAMKEP
jgi:hypothetical protein